VNVVWRSLGSCGNIPARERWPSGRRRTPAKGVSVKSASRVRIPPSPPFSVSADDLLGRKSGGAGKRGPTPKLPQQIERLSHLPKAKQKVVMEMIDGVLSQNR
jgi:hypothetical protein